MKLYVGDLKDEFSEVLAEWVAEKEESLEPSELHKIGKSDAQFVIKSLYEAVVALERHLDIKEMRVRKLRISSELRSGIEEGLGKEIAAIILNYDLNLKARSSTEFPFVEVARDTIKSNRNYMSGLEKLNFSDSKSMAAVLGSSTHKAVVRAITILRRVRALKDIELDRISGLAFTKVAGHLLMKILISFQCLLSRAEAGRWQSQNISDKVLKKLRFKGQRLTRKYQGKIMEYLERPECLKLSDGRSLPLEDAIEITLRRYGGFPISKKVMYEVFNVLGYERLKPKSSDGNYRMLEPTPKNNVMAVNFDFPKGCRPFTDASFSVIVPMMNESQFTIRFYSKAIFG